jgi:RNA polymerase sigma factor (TIGR02999 family)
MNEVTRVLSALEQGDPSAAGQLLPLVDDELRRLAGARLAHEQPGQTLQATALVHEAYLRLVGGERRESPPPSWDSRGHFFAAAAEAMRRILIDAARKKRRAKHGGGRRRLDLDALALPYDDRADELRTLDDALGELARREPVKAEVVKLRLVF